MKLRLVRSPAPRAVGASRSAFSIERPDLALAPTVAMPLQGPPGPQGPPGASGAGYVHAQPVAAAVWTIAHNLGVRPAVAVVDAGGVEVLADVVHLNPNTLQVLFAAPQSGLARLA